MAEYKRLVRTDMQREHPELQFIYVTTTGRKTGSPREIEIWFVEHDGKLYILAEHFFKTQWVLNIARDPRVRVRLGGADYGAIARILDQQIDTEMWATAQRLSRDKYGWGEGLPVELTLDSV